MPDETLVSPIVGRTATKMRVESASITVAVELVDDNGQIVKAIDFEVIIGERNADGTPRWPPVVRAELIDTVKRLARLVGVLP